MTATAKLDEDHAFYFTEENARKIWSILSEMGEVSATVYCADNIERRYDNLDKMLSFENARSNAIKEINLSSFSNKNRGLTYVHLKSSQYLTVSARITSDEETVIRCKQKIQSIFDGMRPWYAPATKIDFLVIFSVITLLVCAVFFTVTNNMGAKASTVTIKFISVALGVCIAGLISAAAVGLNRLRQKYFPIAAFLIGQGQKRYEIAENVRWVVIVGFVVSVVASLVLVGL